MCFLFSFSLHCKEDESRVSETYINMGNRFSAKYEFEKPNDRRALDLMNEAAKGVMTELPEIIIGYGISDEYRFVFPTKPNLLEESPYFCVKGINLILDIALCFTKLVRCSTEGRGEFARSA